MSKHSEGALFSPGLTLHNVRIGEFPETKRRQRLRVTGKGYKREGKIKNKESKNERGKINKRNDTKNSGKLKTKQEKTAGIHLFNA